MLSFAAFSPRGFGPEPLHYFDVIDKELDLFALKDRGRGPLDLWMHNFFNLLFCFRLCCSSKRKARAHLNRLLLFDMG